MSNLTCRVVDTLEDFIQVQKYVIHIFTPSVHNLTRHCDGSFVQWFCSHSHDPWTDQLLGCGIAIYIRNFLCEKHKVAVDDLSRGWENDLYCTCSPRG
jgi:hypothetical protein